MDAESDLVWGARDIAKAIGLKTADQVYTLIRNKRDGGIIRRVGHKLVASRKALIEHLAAGIQARPPIKGVAVLPKRAK
jgi:hypothetical protein